MICLEGTKGAGKSTTIAMVKESMERDGHEVRVLAPFAVANAFAASKGHEGAWPMANHSTEANREEVAFVMEAIRRGRDEGLGDGSGRGRPTTLILDRGWLTLWFHVFEGAWNRSSDTSAVDGTWREVMDEAPPTFFLYADPETTLRRRPGMDPATGLDSGPKVVADYQARLSLADRYRDRIVGAFDTGIVPQDVVVAAIVSHLLDHVRQSSPSPG